MGPLSYFGAFFIKRLFLNFQRFSCCNDLLVKNLSLDQINLSTFPLKGSIWGYSRLPNAKQNTHCQSCTLTTSIPLVWAPKVSISRGVQLHGSQLTQTILASLRYCKRLDTLVCCTTENKIDLKQYIHSVIPNLGSCLVNNDTISITVAKEGPKDPENATMGLNFSFE